MQLLPEWLREFLPILILLAAVAVVLARLPKIDLGHGVAFRRRRVLNWVPLGLTYAFLYMGRYNLTVSKNALGDLMTKADFATIFSWGTVVYACAFIINGPLADRIGGRRTIMLAAVGSSCMNLLLGVVTWAVLTGNMGLAAEHLVAMFSCLYAVNMYFQSFGAVSIVKVNAYWFHVRERGVIGGLFGILISLGIYFAFDWGRMIVEEAPTWWVFFVPAIVLLGFAVIDYFVVQDTPSRVGFADFDTGDASSGDDGPPLKPLQVAGRMLRNPVIVIIACIEFCSGFLRNAIMHWYIIFAKETGSMDSFVASNWGILLCAAGILGGVFAGTISDYVFQSRRGPVAAILYGGMVAGAVGMFFGLGSAGIGWLLVFMSLSVIGVHGMLAGTASMDFGGRKNAGVAVALIDGCVYLGTAAQAITLGNLLPTGAAAKDPANWSAWPVAVAPAALVGLVLATRVWNAKPKPARSDRVVPTSADPGEAEAAPAGAWSGRRPMPSNSPGSHASTKRHSQPDAA